MNADKIFVVGGFVVFVVDDVVVVDARKLPIKFGQNQDSNSGDIADSQFAVVGVQIHFHVTPNSRLN